MGTRASRSTKRDPCPARALGVSGVSWLRSSAEQWENQRQELPPAGISTVIQGEEQLRSGQELLIHPGELLQVKHQQK